jgi:peptide/nickel transport system permease protein
VSGTGTLESAPIPLELENDEGSSFWSFFRSGFLLIIGRRLFAAIPVLWGVTFLTFVIMNLLPGDAAQALLGANATPQAVAQLNQRLHLNEPFFTRYFHWLGGLFSGNLGTSIVSGQSVRSILAQRVPVTFELVVFSFVLSLIVAVPIAILAAKKPGGIVDRLSLVLSMIGLSVAPFIVALILILIFAVKLGWLPAIGFNPVSAGIWPNIKSLILPGASISLPLIGTYTRLLRADMRDQLLGEDYVLTARAKGASPWRVLLRHVMRNSVSGLVTLVALNFGVLIGATVIIEEIFGIPGIGQQLLQSINDRDVVVVEGAVLIFASVVVVANLIADLLYSVLDPRIRSGRSTV